MIIGIGLDICSVIRFGDADRRERFAARYFSHEERERILSRGAAAAECAAGIFAAKEAAMKALGVGLDAIPLTDINLGYTREGAPILSLSGKAKRRANELGASRWHVSISHDAGIAAATVIIEG